MQVNLQVSPTTTGLPILLSDANPTRLVNSPIKKYGVLLNLSRDGAGSYWPPYISYRRSSQKHEAEECINLINYILWLLYC